jgi:hypothetical protein
MATLVIPRCVSLSNTDLRKLRIEAGLPTVESAAMAFGVSFSTWHCWESGRHPISQPGLIWFALKGYKAQLEQAAKDQERCGSTPHADASQL